MRKAQEVGGEEDKTMTPEKQTADSFPLLSCPLLYFFIASIESLQSIVLHSVTWKDAFDLWPRKLWKEEESI